MRPIMKSFGMFLRQIAGDSMLYLVLTAPILAGCAFHFGVPALETLLCDVFNEAAILSDYYLLFDLFLAVMTPYLFCFVSSMVMLSEYDENMACYLAVTPIGRRGYVVSRLFMPAVVSVAASVIVMRFFTLSDWTWVNMILVSVLGGVLSIPVALLVVAFSHNRVEGMALAKLAGVILLGLPVRFFIGGGAQYLFSILPSFWIAKFSVAGNYWALIPGVGASLLWIWALYRKFERKMG